MTKRKVRMHWKQENQLEIVAIIHTSDDNDLSKGGRK